MSRISKTTCRSWKWKGKKKDERKKKEDLEQDRKNQAKEERATKNKNKPKSSSNEDDKLFQLWPHDGFEQLKLDDMKEFDRNRRIKYPGPRPTESTESTESTGPSHSKGKIGPATLNPHCPDQDDKRNQRPNQRQSHKQRKVLSTQNFYRPPKRNPLKPDLTPIPSVTPSASPPNSTTSTNIEVSVSASQPPSISGSEDSQNLAQSSDLNNIISPSVSYLNQLECK